MTARILDGRALASELRVGLRAQSDALRARAIEPRLIVVMVGEDPSSRAYVDSIQRVGAQCGVAVEADLLPPATTVSQLCERLAAYGEDPAVHGVILQQPLPSGIPIRQVADAVPAGKDVDGTNPVNAGRLAFGTATPFVPATPAAVMLLLERSRAWPLRGRNVTVVGRSSVVGLPVALLLLACDATVTITHKATIDLASHVARAEVLVVAAGVPGIVTGSMLRPGATVIDVGTTIVNGKLHGDVDFASASEVAAEITPVPGGVGPVTNVALIRNVLIAADPT